jgi:hypothetical protein
MHSPGLNFDQDPVMDWLRRTLGVPAADLDAARLAVLGVAAAYAPLECVTCGEDARKVDEAATPEARTAAEVVLEEANRTCARCGEFSKLACRADLDPRSDDYERRLDGIVRLLYPESFKDAPNEREAAHRREFVGRMTAAIRAGARITFTCDRGRTDAYVLARERRGGALDEGNRYHTDPDTWAAHRAFMDEHAKHPPLDQTAVDAAVDAFLSGARPGPRPFVPGDEAARHDDGEVGGDAPPVGPPPFPVPDRVGGLAGSAVPMPAYGQRGPAGTNAPEAPQPSPSDLVDDATVASFKAAVAGGLRWLLRKVEDPSERAAQGEAIRAMGAMLDPGAGLRDQFGRPLSAEERARSDFAGAPPVTTADELVRGESAARVGRAPAKGSPAAGPPGYRRLPDGSWIAHGWHVLWHGEKGAPSSRVTLYRSGAEPPNGGLLIRIRSAVCRPFDAYADLALAGADLDDEAGQRIWLPPAGLGVPVGAPPADGDWVEVAPVPAAAQVAPGAEAF